MKSEELTVLENSYRDCTKCPALCEKNQVVFGVGDADKCKLVIIGEAPGKQEDLQGEPFVGRSGKILNGLLEGIGLSRDEVFITNTILCRPPDNRNPSKDELLNCRRRLDETIRILDPSIVVTLGNFSTQYVLETKEGITSIRGKIYEKGSMRVVPMQHPAVLLYHGNSPVKRKEFEDDFEIVKKEINKKI